MSIAILPQPGDLYKRKRGAVCLSLLNGGKILGSGKVLTDNGAKLREANPSAPLRASAIALKGRSH